MLKALEAVLADLNLAPKGSAVRYYITLSKGDTISIRALLSPHKFFQVKASEFIDLREEYEAYVRAWSLYQELVPRPFGYRLVEGWAIMVTEGVHHKPFSVERALVGKGSLRTALNGLYQYFEMCGRQSPIRDVVESHSEFFDKIGNHFAQTVHANLASHWIARGRSLGLESMACVPQHGDFVQNNIASSSGKLVIFDWEDFGKSYLLGVDICSLCFSVAPRLDAMQRLMATGNGTGPPLVAFANRACVLSGLDWDVFRCLIPLYLVVFLYSKREYDPAAQERIAAMVQQLSN